MRWKKKFKMLKLLWDTLCKYGWYKQENVWKKWRKHSIYNDRILWLNEKYIEEGLNHKNVREITIKCHSDHRKLS